MGAEGEVRDSEGDMPSFGNVGPGAGALLGDCLLTARQPAQRDKLTMVASRRHPAVVRPATFDGARRWPASDW